MPHSLSSPLGRDQPLAPQNTSAAVPEPAAGAVAPDEGPPAPLQPSGIATVFRHRQTIRFGDIDQAGIVYYPRFLHYCHVAMEELFASRIGLDYPQLLATHRLGFPAVHVVVDFARPLRYGDQIEVEVAVVEIGSKSIKWAYRLFAAGDTPVATAEVVTVAVSLDTFRSLVLPDWLRERLTRYATG